MKLKEAQLLGIVALIAVAIILLCMWGGGHDSTAPAVTEDQAVSVSGSDAGAGVADLAEDIASDQPAVPAALARKPTTELTVGGQPPAAAATENAAITSAIEENAPQDIPIVTPAPTGPATGAPAAPTAAPAAQTHVVQRGDTLEAISLKYYGTRQKWQEIVSANKGLDPKRLRVGMKLTIPAAQSPTPKKVAAAASAPPALSATVNAPASGQRSYTVQKGDSLFLIAKKCYGDGGRWKDIQAANPERTADARALRPGVVLIIP
jgi:nucleoid-associated protein YgaU